MKKTRYIPYGYTVRNGHTVVEKTEAEVIRRIFEEYIKGSSLKDLASELTVQKIPYTERTDVWNKARVARILENARYTGSDSYDPIIDEQLYEAALAVKAARQRNQTQCESEGIALLRNRVKCAHCGYPMTRRVCSKNRIKQSWTCTNDACGCRVRISDNDLLRKVTLLMNRIITNDALMLPKKKTRRADSPAIAALHTDIQRELEREYPSEAYVIEKITEIAGQLYRESQASERIAAQIARKRVQMMHPQEHFNCAYFTDLVDYITIDEAGAVNLHTKTDTTVGEGE